MAVNGFLWLFVLLPQIFREEAYEVTVMHYIVTLLIDGLKEWVQIWYEHRALSNYGGNCDYITLPTY